MTSAVRRAVEAARRAASQARSETDSVDESIDSNVVVSVNRGGSSRVTSTSSSRSVHVNQKGDD